MKIKKVVVEGFRAYQSKEDGTFDFSMPTGECANFVSLYAPNGFGKTSFYDAVEWALTNNIARFVRDYTRTENDNLSKSQNQPNKKQHILRNRFMDDSAPSSVTIIKDDGTEKIKGLSSARNGSRDYLFKKEQTDEGMETLSEIFLSQEAIDSFLREEKPEARYARFMSKFGDEDEAYRANLTALKRELTILLKKSEDEMASLKIVADTPIKESIFNEVNETIKILNDSSETISPIYNSFDENSERELRSRITKRTHELQLSVSDLEAATSNLLAATSKLEEVSAIKQKKNISKQLLDQLAARRLLLSKRKNLEDLAAALQKNIFDESASESKLIEIQRKLPEFEKLSVRKDTSQDNLQLTHQHLREMQARTTSFSQRRNECIRLMAEIDASTGSLVELQRSSVLIFQQIEANKKLIQSRETYRATRQLLIQALSTKLAHAKEDLRKVEAIEINETAIDSADLTPLHRENFSVLPIKAAFLEKKAKALELERVSQTLDLVRSQATQFARLIELGTSLLSESNSEECPLCMHHHSSHQTLMDKLTNHTGLTALESVAAQSRDSARLALEKASQNVSVLLEEWHSTKMRVAFSLRESIVEDETEFVSLSLELRSIDSDLAQANTQQVSLKSQVKNLSEEQLATYVARELENLKRRRSVEAKDHDTSTLEIENLQKLIKIDLQSIEQHSTEIKLFTDSELANEIFSFCSANSIQPKDAQAHILKCQLEVHARLLETKSRVELINEDIRSIDLEDAALIDIPFEQLENTEANLRATLLDCDSFLVQFSASVKKHLRSYDDEWSSEFLAEKISLTLAQFRRQSNNTSLISRLYLLLGDQLNDVIPYIKSLSANVELQKVSLRYQQELALIASLEAEYSETIKRLRKRINSFFYTDLINAIYRKVDPHPDFKEVQFNCDFPDDSIPKLDVLVSDTQGNVIAPNLYFSAAQINILSLSIFLARALHVKTADGLEVKCIFIDDPIHSMDSINVLATIDMLRAISKKFNRQIILSTHDRNFFELLKKKIPQREYLSKFLELETFGKVRSEFEVSEVANPLYDSD